MSALFRQRDSIRDSNPAATHAYRERTAMLAPSLSNSFRCADCGKDKALSGRRRKPAPWTSKMLWTCADCVEQNKAGTRCEREPASEQSLCEVANV